jgi:hypothetical protein
MRISLRSFTWIALLCFVVTAISVSAATVAKTTTTKAVTGSKKALAAAAVASQGGAAATQGSVQQLDQAYSFLAEADHDYKGHRARAMHHIQNAARALGVRLTGHGKGGEAQTTSDSHLKSAQSLLQSAIGGLTGRPHNQVSDAINQLNIALSIK